MLFWDLVVENGCLQGRSWRKSQQWVNSCYWLVSTKFVFSQVMSKRVSDKGYWITWSVCGTGWGIVVAPNTSCTSCLVDRGISINKCSLWSDKWQSLTVEVSNAAISFVGIASFRPYTSNTSRIFERMVGRIQDTSRYPWTKEAIADCLKETKLAETHCESTWFTWRFF